MITIRNESLLEHGQGPLRKIKLIFGNVLWGRFIAFSHGGYKLKRGLTRYPRVFHLALGNFCFTVKHQKDF